MGDSKALIALKNFHGQAKVFLRNLWEICAGAFRKIRQLRCRTTDG